MLLFISPVYYISIHSSLGLPNRWLLYSAYTSGNVKKTLNWVVFPPLLWSHSVFSGLTKTIQVWSFGSEVFDVFPFLWTLTWYARYSFHWIDVIFTICTILCFPFHTNTKLNSTSRLLITIFWIRMKIIYFMMGFRKSCIIGSNNCRDRWFCRFRSNRFS